MNVLGKWMKTYSYFNTRLGSPQTDPYYVLNKFPCPWKWRPRTSL